MRAVVDVSGYMNTSGSYRICFCSRCSEHVCSSGGWNNAIKMNWCIFKAEDGDMKGDEGGIHV